MKNKTKFILIILTALILNIIWEFSHYKLYYDLTKIPSTPHLILASLTDMILITFIFLIISLKNKSIKWINKPALTDYLFIVLFGLLIAIIIEIVNLNLGRWAYTSAMPTILGIGLSPLVQLVITSIISLFIMKLIFYYLKTIKFIFTLKILKSQKFF